MPILDISDRMQFTQLPTFYYEEMMNAIISTDTYRIDTTNAIMQWSNNGLGSNISWMM